MSNKVEDSVQKFKQLRDNLEWTRHANVPRAEYFVSRIGKPYAYGVAGFSRTYEPSRTHPIIEELWRTAEETAQTSFDVCFLNRYDGQHDQLGWHADDSPEMDNDRPIAIVTLMERDSDVREIWFRPKTATKEVLKLALPTGSIALMSKGMQQSHFHRIPKSSFPCGGRISLTFRGYVEPKRIDVAPSQTTTWKSPQ